MENAYQDGQTAQKYLAFLESENGKIQQQTLAQAILKVLPQNSEISLLDAGCGPGWLASFLKQYYNDIQGCDASEFFVKLARERFKNIGFEIASLNRPLSYPKNHFDCAILNMVGPDLDSLSNAFKNLAVIIKPAGQLILTAPNPKYTYPVTEWKRSWLDVLLGQKPKLKNKLPYQTYKNIKREFNPNGKICIPSNFYTLEDYLQNAAEAGFKLHNKLGLRSQRDSKKFNLTYQLYRYPLLLLLQFNKIG